MSLRVLIVEDSKDDVELIVRQLAYHFGEVPVYRQVFTAVQMDLALLEPDGWDCVICDYIIPGFDWPSALNMIRRWRPGVLFIVISGAIRDDKGKKAIEEGADDYLEKSRLNELGALVDKWIRIKAAHEQHRRAINGLLKALEK